MQVADIRKEYTAQSLSEQDVEAHPIDQFSKWWEQTLKSELTEPNAMTLATASTDGLPSARIVLLKGFDREGFVFYSNYQSYKGMQLEENPRAALVFFWKELERQVRVTGLVQKIADQDSEAYFHSRPVASQIGAAASPQSTVIESREWLDEKFTALRESLNGKEIPRPAHWGGYRVKPVIIEFWQGRRSRLHDRIQYELKENNEWSVVRLAP